MIDPQEVDSAITMNLIGRTIYSGEDSTGRLCYADDRDGLPPDLVTFHEMLFLGIRLDGSPMSDEEEAWNTFREAVARLTLPVMVNFGDYFYEN